MVSPVRVTVAFCGVTEIETRCSLLQLFTASKVTSASQGSGRTRRFKNAFIVAHLLGKEGSDKAEIIAHGGRE
jgi:hypothetical protein